MDLTLLNKRDNEFYIIKLIKILRFVGSIKCDLTLFNKRDNEFYGIQRQITLDRVAREAFWACYCQLLGRTQDNPLGLFRGPA